MKRSYILLVVVLVAVVLAFTYAKSYLSRLESDDFRMKNEMSHGQVVDSLRMAYRMLAEEHTEDLQRRYDSLLEESSTMIYALESQLDLYLNTEFDPVADSVTVQGGQPPDSTAEAGDSLSVVAEEETAVRTTPEEYEIYVCYLERALGLPKDLSSYEKKVATKQIRRDLQREFNLNSGELNSILVKVRTRHEEVEDSATSES